MAATGTCRRSSRSSPPAAKCSSTRDCGARPPRAEHERKLRDKRVGGLYAHMQRVIVSERGRALYGRRQPMIEPVFAQTKVVRRADAFQRRGLSACRSEWRLIAATHNLLKLWRHQPATA